MQISASGLGQPLECIHRPRLPVSAPRTKRQWLFTWEVSRYNCLSLLDGIAEITFFLWRSTEVDPEHVVFPSLLYNRGSVTPRYKWFPLSADNLLNSEMTGMYKSVRNINPEVMQVTTIAQYHHLLWPWNGRSDHEAGFLVPIFLVLVMWLITR